jgi:hypothetical protein
MLAQTGFRTITDNQKHIKINNGSEVRILTAGTKTTGRGFTYHLILCSEAAYYQNSIEVMSSLLKARYKGGSQVIFESTASSGDTHFRRTWEGAYYKKFFTGYEDHPLHTYDPDSIDDDTWQSLQDNFGFTRRDAAAHWWLTLHKDSGGDFIRQIRECPLTPEQAFIAAEGRFISVDPPAKHYAIDKVYPKLHIFTEPDPKGRYIFSVDTSAGIGSDDSVVVVWDCIKNNIAALWVDNHTEIAGLVSVIKYIYSKYKAKYIIVETNGVGHATFQGVVAGKMPALEYKASGNRKESNVYSSFLWAKDQIVNKGLLADERLTENCRSCQIHTNPTTGKTYFSGKKDIIAAISFLGANKGLIQIVATEPEKRTLGPNAFDLQAEIANTLTKKRMR